jgi:hypothetical protein
MFNLQDRIKGIDTDRDYHATRISIRDKLLSQGFIKSLVLPYYLCQDY